MHALHEHPLLLLRGSYVQNSGQTNKFQYGEQESTADPHLTLAVSDNGYSASEVAEALSIGRVSVGQCVYRGKIMVDNDPKLRHILA